MDIRDSQRIKEIRDNTRAMAEAFGRIADALAEALELYVSTQTKTQNSNSEFEKRTMRDCYNCKRYESEEECVECKYEPKQTEPRKTTDYCDDCNHKGCDYCVADSRDDYCIPSNYQKQTEPQFDKDINVRSKDEPQTEVKGSERLLKSSDARKFLGYACETCKHRDEEWDSEACDGCCENNDHYEPQTDCAWK